MYVYILYTERPVRSHSLLIRRWIFYELVSETHHAFVLHLCRLDLRRQTEKGLTISLVSVVMFSVTKKECRLSNFLLT